MKPTQIPSPRVELIDTRTGLMSREWYMFFINLFTITGGGASATTIPELEAMQRNSTNQVGIIGYGEPGEDGLTIVGPQGPQGSAGQFVPGMDGQDGEDVSMSHPPGTNGNAATFSTLTTTDNLTVPKTSGKGIQVDVDAPTFGWRDIIGQIGIKTAGATDPVWALYRGTMYAYTFDSATAEAFFVFHIPHDYVPGTDLYVHIHWSQIVVDTGGAAGVPGNIEWGFDISYADGHGTAGGAADPFTAPITQVVVQQASTTQYGHMLAEVAFTNAGGDATHLDRATIVIDGLILVRIYRVKGNVADTLDQAPFGHTCDIHYQSSNIGTKNKAPDFYV